MVMVVLLAVCLLKENLIIGSVPAAGPVFVRPAEAEREIWFTCSQYVFEGALQHPAAIEPIMVIAEAMDAEGFCQFSLGLACFRQA